MNDREMSILAAVIVGAISVCILVPMAAIAWRCALGLAKVCQ